MNIIHVPFKNINVVQSVFDIKSGYEKDNILSYLKDYPNLNIAIVGLYKTEHYTQNTVLCTNYASECFGVLDHAFIRLPPYVDAGTVNSIYLAAYLYHPDRISIRNFIEGRALSLDKLLG